jgi:hypothetical protein
MIWQGITFIYSKAARDQVSDPHKQQVIFLCILIFIALGRRQDNKTSELNVSKKAFNLIFTYLHFIYIIFFVSVIPTGLNSVTYSQDLLAACISLHPTFWC